MSDKKKKRAAPKPKVCRLCGHPLGETFVYSRFTKSRYCINYNACEERRAAQDALRRENSTSAEPIRYGITPTVEDTGDATKTKRS